MEIPLSNAGVDEQLLKYGSQAVECFWVVLASVRGEEVDVPFRVFEEISGWRGRRLLSYFIYILFRKIKGCFINNRRRVS